MTDTRKALHRGAVRLFAVLVPVALLTGNSPAEAKWLSKPAAVVTGAVVAGGVTSSLRKNIGELPGRFGEALGAFFRDDAGGLEGTFGESLEQIGKIGIDAHPVLAAATRARDAARNTASDLTDNFRDRLESAKRSIGRAGETVTDIRAALAIDRDERQWYESEARVLDKAPLPSVRVSRTRRAPDSSSNSMAEAWGMDAEAIRRSRDPATWAPKPDPWGQDAGKGWDSPPTAPAAAKVDVWSADAGESERGRPGGASVATADPWGRNTGQGSASAAAAPVVGDVGADPVDAEWQNEYAAALNHFLGLDDEDGSYEAALSTVERLEHEAVERERLAEQQRRETQERERQARIEAEKRQRQIARIEAEIESAKAERRRQANTEAFVRGVQNAVSALQPMLDSTASRIQRDREARLRRELATLREQARALEARAAIERQQQQAADQQRRQAAKQARLEQDLRRSIQRCDTKYVLVNECLPGSSTYFECEEENRRIVERHVRSCKQRAWDAYNRSGGGTILGVGRLE